jgi:hypothetical protein
LEGHANRATRANSAIAHAVTLSSHGLVSRANLEQVCRITKPGDVNLFACSIDADGTDNPKGFACES